MRTSRHIRRRSDKTFYSSRAVCAAIVTAVISGVAPVALCSTYNFTGASAANWNVAANWTLSGGTSHAVPGNGDSADLGSLGNFAGSVNFNMNYASPGLSNLTINAVSPSTMTLNQTTAGTTMVANVEYLGTTIFGNIYNQSAGTNTTTLLQLATSNPLSQGEYVLSGGTLNVSGNEFIGESDQTNNGGNLFYQSGGTNNVGSVFIGLGGAATGAYNFSGGALNVASLVIGASTATTNTFTQSGNSVVTVSSDMDLGYPGGSGTYALNAGSVVMNNSLLYIGNGGIGTFNQSAGSVTFTGANSAINVGVISGGFSSYILSGTGTVSGAPVETIGGASSAVFTQTVGTSNTLASGGTLNLATGQGSGTYQLYGGSLTAANINDGTVNLNGSGLFYQSGGTLTSSGETVVGLLGTYTMTGGTANLSSTATAFAVDGAALSGAGVASLSGGAMNASSGTMSIGDSGPGLATFNLSGSGQLNVNSLSVGTNSAGAFYQTGGAITSTGESVGGLGPGSFNQSSGSNSTGTLALGSSALSGNGGVFYLKGGTLNVAGVEFIGLTHYGNFSQTGGLNIASGGLAIAGSLSSYNLSAGVLSTTSINVSSGLLSLSNGAITAGSINLNGVPTRFVWTSGILDITGTGSAIGGTLVVPNNGLLRLDGSITDPVAVNAGGVFNLNPTTGTGILVRNLKTITLNSGTSPSAKVSVLVASKHSNRQFIVATGLSFAGGTNSWQGLVDLANNDLDVQGGSLTNLTNQIKQGQNGGIWNGIAGITSSSAAADNTHLTALGIILNGNTYGTAIGSLGLFDGTNPNATDVLIKYTYYGDANLDGQVDGSDYTRIDNGFVNKLTGWGNGDFNYDGVINGSDYTLIDNAFNTQGGSLTSAVQIASSAAQIATSSSVPEPISGGLVIAMLAQLSSRRRRRCNP